MNTVFGEKFGHRNWHLLFYSYPMVDGKYVYEKSDFFSKNLVISVDILIHFNLIY